MNTGRLGCVKERAVGSWVAETEGANARPRSTSSVSSAYDR